MKPFVPSPTDLNDMVRRAMAKCDADIERHREQKAEDRMERTILAEAAQKRRNFWRKP